MTGGSKPKEKPARGKSKSTRKGATKSSQFNVSDTIYYKRGNVQVFPDVMAPKPTLFKKARDGKILDVHPSRRHKTAGRDAKKSFDETSLVAESQQHSQEKEESSLETFEESSLVDAEKCADKTSLVAESQQQVRDKEGSSLETHEITPSVDTATEPIQESMQHKSEIDLRSSKDGHMGERLGNKTKIKEPNSYVLDQEKLVDANVQEQLRAEECECRVIQMIKAALEEAMGPEDPPVFLLHNQSLDVTVQGKRRTKIEQDVLILHPTLGVLLVEVKAVKSRTSFSRFDAATEQLLRAKDFVLEEMGDLLGEDAIVLTMALPELQPEDSTFIRHRDQELASGKQGHDVTAATSSPADKTGQSGEEGHFTVPKFKGTALLGDHPEIFLLCGSTADVFTEWVGWLREQRPRSGHAFKGATEAERLDNFKRARIRHLSVPGLRPGQSVKISADLHHRFLLTEEQLQVRDSKAELLHISGPPGSGKTLLLVECARRWLREGRHVALAVGLPIHDLLLHHLARSLWGKKEDVARISTHKGYYDLLHWLDSVSPEDPVSVILDEASAKLPEVYGRLLDHVQAGRVSGLWSADTQPLSDERKRELRNLGGRTAELNVCLRCPPHVMNWINVVRSEKDLPLLPPPVPITRELGVGVKVISHPDHPQSQSWEVCPSCTQDTKAFFASLGLQGDHSKSALELSDVVIITTVSSCDRSRVARWLCSLGLHAVAEADQDRVTLPFPAGGPLGSHHQALKEARSRMSKGIDVKGNPAIHVVGSENFTGLEKPVVLLWHEDREDVDQYDNARDIDSKHHRLFRHSHSWFVAATRCQGRLAVMAATPSPLLSMLPFTSPLEISSHFRRMRMGPEAQRRRPNAQTRASDVRGEVETQSPPASSSAPFPAAAASGTPPSVPPSPENLTSLPAPSSSADSEVKSSEPIPAFSALSGAVPFHTFQPTPATFETVPSQPFPPTSAPSEATSSHSFMPFSAPVGLIPSYHVPSSSGAFEAKLSHPFPSISVPLGTTPSSFFTPFSVSSGITPSYHFYSSPAAFGAMPSEPFRPPSAPFGAMPFNVLPPCPPHSGTMPPYPSRRVPPRPSPSPGDLPIPSSYRDKLPHQTSRSSCPMLSETEQVLPSIFKPTRPQRSPRYARTDRVHCRLSQTPELTPASSAPHHFMKTAAKSVP